MNFDKDKYTKIFETFILKPLWLGYFISAIFSFILKEWIIGGFLLLVLFYLGWIGGAIVNRGKTFKELSKGTLPQKWPSNEDGLTPAKAWHLGETVQYTSYAIVLTVIVIMFKGGYKFYISIPVGLASWFIFKKISLFLTVFLAEKLK